VLREVKRDLEGRLTPYDRADIKSGTERWQKTADYEVLQMRQEGLLQPDSHDGVWALTVKGKLLLEGPMAEDPAKNLRRFKQLSPEKQAELLELAGLTKKPKIHDK